MKRFREVRRERTTLSARQNAHSKRDTHRQIRNFPRAGRPAPTSFFGASGRFVGVDAHIAPAERTDFTITFGEFVIAKWGDEGIAPAQIWNPSSEKRTAVLVKQQSVFYLPSSMRKSLLAFSLVALPTSSGVSPRSCAIFAATKGTSDGSLRRPR